MKAGVVWVACRMQMYARDLSRSAGPQTGERRGKGHSDFSAKHSSLMKGPETVAWGPR